MSPIFLRCCKLEKYYTNCQNFYSPCITFYSQMRAGEWNFTPLYHDSWHAIYIVPLWPSWLSDQIRLHNSNYELLSVGLLPINEFQCNLIYIWGGDVVWRIQSFKKIEIKLLEELCSQSTHSLCLRCRKMTEHKFKKKWKKIIM